MASKGSNSLQYHKETKPAREGSKRRGGGGGGGGVRLSTDPQSIAAREGSQRRGGGGGGGGVRLSTDPQSIAARERRHRISNRFKILQSMVPGGTKMDTVSMLEEAIHYVKFLKTQITFHQSVISNPAHHLALQLQSSPSYSCPSPPDLPVTHLPTPLPAHDDHLLGEVNLPPLPPSCFHQGGDETQTICFPPHFL